VSPTPCPKDAAPLTEKANLLGPGHSGLVCPKCAGVQVPWSEAQKFFERLGLSLADLQSAVKQARPRPGQQTPPECTACHAGPMKPFTVKGVELDLCEACGSTWFDRGELQRISKGKLGQELAQAPVAAPDERVETVGVFQMFWDCAFCGTTALLGQKHLCCPSCGAQQDAARRYFPPPGQEVAANTQFDGADRLCPACQTPNGAAAKFCRSCGSPLEGSQEAARVADRVAQPPRPTTPQSKRTPVWVWVIGVLLVLSCVTCGVAMTWTRSSTATVTGHTWKREVDVEQLAAASDSAWCDSVPSGAYDVSRHREQRSTKKVADGEECGTRDVDRGNGTFERRRECHPKSAKSRCTTSAAATASTAGSTSAR
jgi:Zn-finger nucleic acid-binding protein